jgi:hypothetical protein
MAETDRPDEVSARDEAPARRGEQGDILGGETVGTEDTAMGEGAEGDISHGDGGMGAGRGADVPEERPPGDPGGHEGPGGP